MKDEDMECSTELGSKSGIDVFRLYTKTNDLTNMQRAIGAVTKAGKHAEGTIMHTETLHADLIIFLPGYEVTTENVLLKSLLLGFVFTNRLFTLPNYLGYCRKPKILSKRKQFQTRWYNRWCIDLTED